MQIDLFNPTQSYPYRLTGVSPMQAIAIQAEMDDTANRWNWNFFKNGATSGDILETEQKLTPENKKRAIQQWRNEYQ